MQRTIGKRCSRQSRDYKEPQVLNLAAAPHQHWNGHRDDNNSNGRGDVLGYLRQLLVHSIHNRGSRDHDGEIQREPIRQHCQTAMQRVQKGLRIDAGKT